MNIKIHIPEHNLGSYSIPSDCRKDFCVDIGANIGDFTVSQAANFKVLHFYEPFAPCFNKIKNRVEQFDNVVGFMEAVYSEDGKKLPLIAHLNHDAGSTALKTDAINEDWQDELDLVDTVSFGTIMERVGGSINYLKVDCETSEYYLFINQDLTQIDYIGVELHWQMGEKKYNELINHILKTHTTSKDYSWSPGWNKEVLFRNKLL
jgi:FkbM family methyltransferase